MKIKMLSTYASAEGVFSAGVVYEFPEDVALSLIAAKAAEALNQPRDVIEVAAKDMALVEKRGRKSKLTSL